MDPLPQSDPGIPQAHVTPQQEDNFNPPSQFNPTPNFSPSDIQRNYPYLNNQQTYMPYMSYMPPNQYGGIPNVQQVFQGQFNLEGAIKNLEFKLNGGWYFAYTIWVWVISIIVSLYGLLVLGAMMSNKVDVTFTGFMAILLCVWNVHYGYVIFKAMNNFDLKGAKDAFLSMIIFAVFYFIWIISRYTIDGGPRMTIINVVLTLVVFHFIPMGIYLFGAYSVRRILEERETLLKIENVNAA